MYCIHCGNPIPENSKFCSQCGKEQVISKVETKTEVANQEGIPNNTLSSFKSTISRLEDFRQGASELFGHRQ